MHFKIIDVNPFNIYSVSEVNKQGVDYEWNGMNIQSDFPSTFLNTVNRKMKKISRGKLIKTSTLKNMMMMTGQSVNVRGTSI